MNDIQEKAKKLVDKFMNVHETAGGIGMNRKQAKQCALICVDEILGLGVVWFDEGLVGRNYIEAQDALEYWERVKKTIENGSF